MWITDNELILQKNNHRWITRNALYMYAILGPADRRSEGKRWAILSCRVKLKLVLILSSTEGL